MRTRIVLALSPFLLVVACGAPEGSARRTGEQVTASVALQLPDTAAPIAQEHVRSIHVCPGPGAPGDARCHAHVVVDEHGAPAATLAPRGYGPADLYAAYNLGTLATGSTWDWNGQTIAIVDAYDHPYAESDLNVYRSQFGLPPCTTTNGCFRKIDQNGGNRYPRANCGWAQEISLDLDMASAICPRCKILLVEAASNSFSNLAAAVNQAVAKGANVISNSYGGSESSSVVSAYAGAYKHPGVVITASSGDGGYGVEIPAAFNTVVAVGGTSLRGSVLTDVWTETVWSGAGSGCSAYVSKPTWQKDAGCVRRTVADVAAVADPATGVAVYDSYSCQGAKGWLVFGGTSVSAPIIASVYALAGNASNATAQSLYSTPASLFDVTSGSNGSCGGSYLCTGGIAYDGPTGNGTPNGMLSF
jgi:subtilase family serine protease